MKKLIDELRANASGHPLDIYAPILSEAADALESQAREIERAAFEVCGVPVYQLQCREIGEGDWRPADLRHYTYCQQSPEMDTRIVEVQQARAALPVREAAPDEMRSLAQRLREYNLNPHHINPMSEAFHMLVAEAADALSASCTPKEVISAITWADHLIRECFTFASTRAPSIHVYNKTFEAVNAAKALLAAAPSPSREGE